MITLDGSSLIVRFPSVHEKAIAKVDFLRTLRVPASGAHPEPPVCGALSPRHVDDYPATVPEQWLERGGVMLPLHRGEAMRLSFSSSYPFAIKVAAGKINALNGAPWAAALETGQQDYIIIPDQNYLDGFSTGCDSVHQFVAVPLGAGYSAEEQRTGRAEYGGLQLIVYPMRASAYKLLKADCGKDAFLGVRHGLTPVMALAAGGQVKQAIQEDRYGIETWDRSQHSRCFVTLVDASDWLTITGEPVPYYQEGIDADKQGRERD